MDKNFILHLLSGVSCEGSEHEGGACPLRLNQQCSCFTRLPWCAHERLADHFLSKIQAMISANFYSLVGAIDDMFGRQLKDGFWLGEDSEYVGTVDFDAAFDCWSTFIKPELLRRFTNGKL